MLTTTIFVTAHLCEYVGFETFLTTLGLQCYSHYAGIIAKDG